MPLVIFACCVIVVTTTILHYEVLRPLNTRLPTLSVPDRSKLVVVILAAFVADRQKVAA